MLAVGAGISRISLGETQFQCVIAILMLLTWLKRKYVMTVRIDKLTKKALFDVSRYDYRRDTPYLMHKIYCVNQALWSLNIVYLD